MKTWMAVTDPSKLPRISKDEEVTRLRSAGAEILIDGGISSVPGPPASPQPKTEVTSSSNGSGLRPVLHHPGAARCGRQGRPAAAPAGLPRRPQVDMMPIRRSDFAAGNTFPLSFSLSQMGHNDV